MANSDAVAITPLLCGIAVAALVVGSAMVPLLAAFPLDPGPRRSGTAVGLPLRFLGASIIGIVALGALPKAVLHLPAQASGTSVLMLLIAGRTLSAFLPIRIGSLRRGLMLLAAAYGGAAAVAAGFAFGAAPGMLVLLGLSLGATNLVGWALLPALAGSPGGYGLYTMTSKLALGAAGLALAGGLGRSPAFSPDGFARFAWIVAVACIVAALLAGLRLTSPAVRRF